MSLADVPEPWSTAIVEARRVVRPPAITLIVFLVAAIVLEVVVLVHQSAFKLPHEKPTDPEAFALANVALITPLIGLHVALLVGAVKLLRMTSYRAAWNTAVVSVIPFLSPGMLLGILPAAWVLFTIDRKSVRLGFQAVSAARGKQGPWPIDAGLNPEFSLIPAAKTDQPRSSALAVLLAVISGMQGVLGLVCGVSMVAVTIQILSDAKHPQNLSRLTLMILFPTIMAMGTAASGYAARAFLRFRWRSAVVCLLVGAGLIIGVMKWLSSLAGH